MKRASILLVVALLIPAVFAGFRFAQSREAQYTITADVEQGPNLFAGGRVMVRGVEVGTISAVEPRTEGVRLTLQVDEGVKVPADVRLAVVPVTVISDRYVQLLPPYGGGPELSDGAHIPLSRTSIPAELDDVLTQLQGLLKALEPGKKGRGPLARLITALDGALDGHSDDLAAAIEGSSEVLGNLASNDVEISGLIRNLDSFFLSLADRSSEIGIVNERFALVAQALLEDQADLEGTIENVAFLAEELTFLVDESGDQIGGSLDRLSRVVNKILDHRAELVAGMKWSNVISQTLGATDPQGRGLHAYSGRQAAPGTPGSEYNYRLDTRDTITCERLQAVADVQVVFAPDATFDQIVEAMMSFIPVEYHPHIEFLIRQLIEECVDFRWLEQAGAAERALILELEDQIGRKRLMEMVMRWLIEGEVEAP